MWILIRPRGQKAKLLQAARRQGLPLPELFVLFTKVLVQRSALSESDSAFPAHSVLPQNSLGSLCAQRIRIRLYECKCYWLFNYANNVYGFAQVAFPNYNRMGA